MPLIQILKDSWLGWEWEKAETERGGEEDG